MSEFAPTYLDQAGAPAPMASLTHRVISPENIATETRLNRAKPMNRRQVRQCERELKRLRKRIEQHRAWADQQFALFTKIRDTLAAFDQQQAILEGELRAAPDDKTLQRQWRDLHRTAQPLHQELKALRAILLPYGELVEKAESLQLRIAENPKVVENAKAEEAALKLQHEEARAYEQLIIDRFTQLGYCYRWKDKQGNTKVDEVRFSEAHITQDAVYYKIAASYRSMFGAWKTQLPYTVKITDLVKEETLVELAYACQRQVTHKASLTGGAWIIVHRLDTNDGLMNQVTYTKAMESYPRKYHDRLPLCVGVSYHRRVQWLNLADYPHMLVAGFTGSGKSNFINSLICTLIARHTPDEVRLLLVDLKDGIEFSSYEKVPHLHGEMVDKIVTLADRLQELEAIMQERNRLMRASGVKSIQAYNAKHPSAPMPRLVCIIDEVASIIGHGELTKRINHSLRQLTAKGRAPGLHIILSTQRPSVDAIDGGIKTNLNARIVGRMPSHTDSLTVLGTGAASTLAAVPGRMILQISPDPIPVQTPFIEEIDIIQAVKAAMDYPTPDPLPIPENANLADEWTPEKMVELSIIHLGGRIDHKSIWAEVKEEGGISRAQVRKMLEGIWAMDCIPFGDQMYRVETGKGHIRKLVPIEVSETLKN